MQNSHEKVTNFTCNFYKNYDFVQGVLPEITYLFSPMHFLDLCAHENIKSAVQTHTVS